MTDSVNFNIRSHQLELNAASMEKMIIFSSDGNLGTQVGINSGHIINNISQPVEEKPKPSSTVPFRRDPDFVDPNILTEVHKICSKPASRAALVGLGGVGKSQLAIEYSYRIREQSPQTWIFWVHASNAARFEESYRLIAERIKLPGRDQPRANILQLVSNWLSDEANGRWMMILDNADDSAAFSDPRNGGTTSGVHATASLSTFLPQTPNGSILVTSRNKDAAFVLTKRHCDIIKIEPMNEEHALLLLEKKIQGEFRKSDAIELLRALDYMPLAISEAAAYISQRAPRTTLAKYLELFRQSNENQMSLLNRDAGDLRRDREAVNSIVTTWQISFEYIRAKRPSAARLLSLMSLFDRQGIPEFLLYYYDDEEDGGSSIELKDLKDESHLTFEDDVFTLTCYSLIKDNVTDKHFEMHRLVQLSTRKWLQLNSELEKWKKLYIRIMLKALPEANYENWKVCQVLFPHAEAVLAYRPDEKNYLLPWSEILLKASVYAVNQGKFPKAEELSRRALDERTKTLGDEHPDTLKSISFLAWALMAQDNQEPAEELSRRALDGREKTLGKEHPSTLAAVSNLAIMLSMRQKYEAAEELHRRALDAREKALGKEHPVTLATVSDFAMMFFDQGKYETAEELSRRALDGIEKRLGKEHPNTLMAVTNLASVLSQGGKYKEAEELARRALDGNEKALGKEHRDTLATVSGLAKALALQQKYEAAEELLRRALDVREKAMGKEHPDTLITLGDLALVIFEQKKYEAAEEFGRRALDGSERTWGKEHKHTLVCSKVLAMALMNQKKYEAAVEMTRRALDGIERTIKKEEISSILLVVKSMTVALVEEKKYKTAEELLQRALAGNEKALGKVHSETLVDVGVLAMVLMKQEKYEAAEELYHRKLDESEKILGKEDPDTLKIVIELAKALAKQKKSEAAEELFRRALNRQEKTLGKKHPNTLTTVSDLAMVLADQKKYKAAEKLLRQALDRMEQAMGKEHPDTVNTVLLQQRKYEAAEELSRRALDRNEKARGKEHPNTRMTAQLLQIVLMERRKYEAEESAFAREDENPAGDFISSPPFPPMYHPFW